MLLRYCSKHCSFLLECFFMKGYDSFFRQNKLKYFNLIRCFFRYSWIWHWQFLMVLRTNFLYKFNLKPLTIYLWILGLYLSYTHGQSRSSENQRIWTDLLKPFKSFKSFQAFSSIVKPLLWNFFWKFCCLTITSVRYLWLEFFNKS